MDPPFEAERSLYPRSLSPSSILFPATRPYELYLVCFPSRRALFWFSVIRRHGRLSFSFFLFLFFFDLLGVNFDLFILPRHAHHARLSSIHALFFLEYRVSFSLSVVAWSLWRDWRKNSLNDQQAASMYLVVIWYVWAYPLIHYYLRSTYAQCLETGYIASQKWMQRVQARAKCIDRELLAFYFIFTMELTKMGRKGNKAKEVT